LTILNSQKDISNIPNESVDNSSSGEKEFRNEASEIWTKFLEIVKLNVSELKFNTWFRPIRAKSFSNKTLLISVPSADFYDIIISRFGDLISKAKNLILGEETRLIYEIDETINAPLNSTDPEYSGQTDQSIRANAPIMYELLRQSELSKEKIPVARDEQPSSVYRPALFLKTEYSFENFVKGKNNEFATAAAFSISNKPGSQYNPLLIYGGVGLGKTHLVQAIGNQIRSNDNRSNVMYTSGPEFTTSFVQSIRTNKTHEFEKFYKSLEILIVDDIQFLQGKSSTQEIFFQIFNSLYQLKKQIVLSCDKPPHQLEALEDRLITRFQWGLTVDIQPPDLETRIAILMKKCEMENVAIDYEILEFIALNIKDNIRSLEGCLKNIIFESEMYRMPFTIDMAKRSVVKYGFSKNRKQNLDISTIITEVAKFYDIDEALLRLKSKRQEIVLARHTAMYLAKELTSCSLQTIGAHFGGRNHATVIHACKCIENEITNNSSFSEKMEKLKENLLTS
jgi:chromosomal replication initiator protein